MNARRQTLIVVTAAVLAPACLIVNSHFAPYSTGTTTGPIPAASSKCAAAEASDEPQGPVLFFTDLLSGPGVGGEGNLGVFVTLYGLRFGATPGRVTVGGVDVAKIVTWNPPFADMSLRTVGRGLQTITVQLGPQAKSGPLLVTVGAHSSNAIVFAVRTGNIYFIDPAAAAFGDGSVKNPWQHLYDAELPAVKPGDTVYIKGGVFNQLDPSTAVPNHDSNWLLTPSTAASGTAQFPIAYVGYPGAPPTIGGTPSGDRTTHTIWMTTNNNVPPPDHYVFANLRFTLSNTSALPLTGPGNRVVGNAFVNTFSPYESAAVSFANGASTPIGAAILGNFFYQDTGSAVAMPGAVAGVDIGWNEFHTISGNPAIDTQSVYSNDSIGDLQIHDNLFTDLSVTAFQLFDNLSRTAPGISIFNNVMWVQPQSADIGLVSLNVPLILTDIANNTLLESQSVGTENAPASPVCELRNNVFFGWSAAPEIYMNPPSSAFVFSHNLYFGGTPDSSSLDSAPITANPLLTSISDPNLLDPTPLRGSPAIDAGVDTGHCADYFGVLRPQGTAYDIGAAEYVPP